MKIFQPWTVNIMALTATATKTRKKLLPFSVCCRQNFVSPEKSNITYWVHQKRSVDEVFTPIAKHKRANVPRVIVKGAIALSIFSI